ncbi:FMN-binding protein [Carnobacterium inhibens]|uniref:oxidoreductase n=1 Tax=Carnobacterium inhibens TaxID=147709 RepID=UPI000689BD7A|nr:FMN-binding protein [Carnobacterium inhibens]
MSNKLFEKMELKSGAVLKNRIMMAPMTIQAAYFDGTVTQEMIDYYAHRSGEAGAIIVESSFVEDKGRGFAGALGNNKDSQVKELCRLANAIKEKGSKSILQIYHAGRMAAPELNGGAAPISASPVAALRPEAVTPRQMMPVDIDRMIQSFADATRRAIEAGFDGVEIHGANTYLIQQFFSPHSNRREDKWGGSREARAKFPEAVMKAVQEEVKKQQAEHFIVGYRFSPEEIEEPGIRFEDTMYLLNRLAKLKPDYFHVSMGSWNRTSIIDKEDSQPLLEKYIEQQSEELAQIALIGVGGIGQRSDAEAALEAGYDLVAVGKAFLVEPNWVEKTKSDEEIKDFADINEQDRLQIPEPLWDVMDFMIKDVKAEEEKYEYLKELQNTKITFNPGTYEASVEGHDGSDILMKVTFSDTKILAIELDRQEQLDAVATSVFKRLPEEIITGQTLQVDVISGATVTSKSLIDGVADAVEKANGNSEALRVRSKDAVQWESTVVG